MAGVRTDAGRNHAAIGRLSVDKFSRVVSQEEIRANEYNLNIPRYVDSSEAAEPWDIYASMFGGMQPTSRRYRSHGVGCERYLVAVIAAAHAWSYGKPGLTSLCGPMRVT